MSLYKAQKAQIEPGPGRRPGAPIHVRRRPRAQQSRIPPPETLKTTPEHAEVTRCAGVTYSRQWQACPFQVPAARHDRAALASGDLAVEPLQCRFIFARGLSGRHPASFHPQGNRYAHGRWAMPTGWPRRGMRFSGWPSRPPTPLKCTFVLFSGTESAAVRNPIGWDAYG